MRDAYRVNDGTTGWTCLVDFSSETGLLRLAYFFNVEHILFANSLHREFGSPVDGGEFKGDPILKKRRDQWYGKTQRTQHSTRAPAFGLLSFSPFRDNPESRLVIPMVRN